MKRLLQTGFLLLLSFLGFSQQHTGQRFWQLTGLTGGVKLGAEYRSEEGTSNGIYNFEKTPIALAGIQLNTSSYFWHPNFLMLDLGGEYNPEWRQENILVIPDRSEARTVSRLNATATFFQEKPITLSLFTNYTDSYTSRENLSSVRVKALNFGTNMAWANRFLPLQINYIQSKWDELEIETDRRYSTDQIMLQGNLSKSFTSKDRNELVYFHNDYKRTDPNFIETRNISDNVNLRNSLALDKEMRYLFTSLITGTDQRGTDAFRRLQAYENINLRLPAKLRFNGNYNYSNILRSSQQSVLNNLNASLSHQLYQSLTTTLAYEYSNARNTGYRENSHKYGAEAMYEKRIPKGKLFLSGSYYRQNLDHTSESTLLQILDEEHRLTDGDMELLNQPNVLTESVVITDLTGTIIYQPLSDYILIERNTYIEVQRMPGGLIPNSSTVKVDYTVLQPGDYKYHVTLIHFNASLQLFNRLLEVYYRRSTQDYDHLLNTEFLTLNYVTQNIYGLRLNYRFLSAGAEYENYQSSVLPYNLWSYYLQFQGSIREKFLYSVNGNLKDYQLLYNQSDQRYGDLSGNFAYLFSRNLRLTIEAGYRKQIGEGIDLDLLTSRAELTADYRMLHFKLGGEFYRRIYLGEEMNYYGAYFEVVRRIGWNKR